MLLASTVSGVATVRECNGRLLFSLQGFQTCHTVPDLNFSLWLLHLFRPSTIEVTLLHISKFSYQYEVPMSFPDHILFVLTTRKHFPEDFTSVMLCPLVTHDSSSRTSDVHHHVCFLLLLTCRLIASNKKDLPSPSINLFKCAYPSLFPLFFCPFKWKFSKAVKWEQMPLKKINYK